MAPIIAAIFWMGSFLILATDLNWLSSSSLVAGPMPSIFSSAVVNVPYKTHLAYVKERRTDKEGEKILEDALRKLRGDDIE